jgi:hypothetical protein
VTRRKDEQQRQAVQQAAVAMLDAPPPDGRTELAGVPRLVRVTRESERAERRNAIRNLFTTKQSTVLAGRQEGLTASAMVMDPTAFNAPSPNAVTRTWQHAAYGYVNTVGELNAGRMYVGNALSRCTLAVGKRNPDGSVEQGYDGEEPVADLDSAVAAEAAELIAQIQAKRGGQSELLRSSGEKMFVAGELYYVPEDTPSGMMFDVLSTQELLRDGNTWTKYLGPGYGAEPLPPGVTPIRVWRPDGQWSMLATSSVRSCLEILEELVVLTRLVRSSAISRMALAGILVIPDELDNPDEEVGPDGGMAEATNPLAVDMINTGAKAIDDPANASAWMPYIIQGPAEYLAHLRHVPFEAASQEQVIERTEALQRLAQGLDLPVEVILGHMNTTFTNAQQISIDTFRIHLEPTLQLISDALTVAYLWPAMAKARGIDPTHLEGDSAYPEDILGVAVTYDAHQLISQPDRTKEMMDVYHYDLTQQTIKIAEIRDALNLDPAEVVDPEEVAARVDAIRLTKIRETIAAPPSDAAVGIESIDQAVVPGQSAGAQLIEAIGTDDKRGGPAPQAPAPSTQPTQPPAVAASAYSGAEIVVAHRIAGAVEVTAARMVERLGAKVRAKAKPTERSQWADIASVDLPRVLGIDQMHRILAADVDKTLATEAASLASHASDWAAAGEIPLALAIGRRASDMATCLAQENIRSGAPMSVALDTVFELLGLPVAQPVG